jgi:hypothetical protein
MRLKLVELDTEGGDVMLGSIEGVNKNLYESTFTLSNYLRLTLRERTSYYLVLEGEPPYSIPEGALNVEFFSKSVRNTLLIGFKSDVKMVICLLE